jgi:hypothetical protein
VPEAGDMERDVSRLEDQIVALTSQTREWQANMTRDFAELKTLVREHPLLCPYREKISAIESHERRIGGVETSVHDLQIMVAKSGAVGGLAGGGTVGVIGAIVFGIGKAAGWW